MKRRTKIGLGVLGCLALTIGGVAYWQWNTVEAVIQATQYTAEEIEEKQKANKEKVQTIVDADPSITVRDLTEEEKQALREGTMTQEELTEKLVEAVSPQPIPETTEPAQEETPARTEPQQPAAPPAASTQPETPPAEETPAEAPEQAQWQKDLSALIARVYVLREEYTIALDNMQAQATEEYRGMKNRTKKNLVKFAQSYVSEALALEKKCDKQMDEIVAQMETIISENGGDMTLVDTVVETYASEKSLKKAWYMAELEKRGWI